MRLRTATAIVAALFLAVCLFGHTVALRLLLLGSGILLAAAVLAKNRGTVQALPPIWLAFLAWGAWAALSLVWSQDPEFTQWEWRNEVFYTAAALWICYVAAQSPNAVRIFASILAAAAVLAAALAVRDFSRGLAAYQEGWHGGPGDHSSALLVLMPCVAVGAWYAQRARWPLGLSAAIACLGALLLVSAYTTLNRTLWLGFAAQFAVLGVLLLLRSPLALRSSRAKAAAAGAAVAAVVGCSVVLVNIQAERELVGARSVQGDYRLRLWPEVIRHVAERPITGHGFGRGVLRERLQESFGSVDRNLWHAHNLFLEALLQTGVAGLVLLVILLGQLVREGWRAARDRDDAQAACGILLLAVLAGVLARNMTDSLLVRQNALLFWGMVGVLLGLRRGVLRHPAP